MFFKPEFKEEILKRNKIATIRKTQEVKVGSIFKVLIGTKFESEHIGYATCLGVLKIQSIIEANTGVLRIKYSSNTFFATPRELGFSNSFDAVKFYEPLLEKYNKGYLHLFEINKGV